MQKAHDATYNNYWKNLPNVDTPIIAAQLNRNEQTVDELDDRIITLDTNKADQSDMNDAVQAITYDSTDGSFTISKFGGTVTTYDTDIDKIPTSHNFIDNPNDAHYKNLAVTLADNTVNYTDMTAVVTENDFNTSGTIQYSVSTTGIVEFDIVDYSVTDTKMQPNYLADITAQATSASTSATSASSSKVDSEAWAAGTRNGIPVSMGDPTYQNNAKYYAQHGQGTSFSGLADTLFTDLQDGQIPIYNSYSQLWENGKPQEGGKAKIIINGESGSTMSVLFPSGQTVTPTLVTSTTWSFDTSDYGTYVITATKNGSSISSNLEIRAMQIYEITVSFFSATITVTYPTGATVTCSKEGETTQTATSSPYTFTVHVAGTWTIAGERNGITEMQSVLIENNGDAKSVTLTILPNGSTVTPTDDVQTLLKCADIWDKAYTAISELIADDTSLLTVLTSDNAIDYLVRSTTFASAITADADAMAMIGSYDYASDTLLSDSTWATAIIGSAYNTSVANVSTPKMTSDTTPKGICYADYTYSSSYKYRAFDKDDSTYWTAGQSVNHYIGYEFTKAVKIFGAKVTTTNYTQTFSIRGDLTDTLHASVTQDASTTETYLLDGINRHTKFDLYITANGSGWTTIIELDFLGRENGGVQTWLRSANITDKDYTTLAEVLADTTTLATLIANHDAVDYLVTAKAFIDGIVADATAMSYIGLNNYCADTLLADADWLNGIRNSTYKESVLNVKVPTMTSATTPSGEVFANTYAGSYYPWYAFGNKSTEAECWATTGNQTGVGYIGYNFGRAVKIVAVMWRNRNSTQANRPLQVGTIQGSNDGTTWVDIADVTTQSLTYNAVTNGAFGNNSTYSRYRLLVKTPSDTAGFNMQALQFYGREDV